MPLVREAVPDGRVATLQAMRDVVATAVDTCESSRDLPALTRQLADVLRQLEELAPPVVEVDDVDEIAQRRAARHASAAKGASRAKRSS